MGYIETLLQNEKGTCKLRMGDSKLWVGVGFKHQSQEGGNSKLRSGKQQDKTDRQKQGQRHRKRQRGYCSLYIIEETGAGDVK